jgi:hypothetical protein
MRKSGAKQLWFTLSVDKKHILARLTALGFAEKAPFRASVSCLSRAQNAEKNTGNNGLCFFLGAFFLIYHCFFFFFLLSFI